MISPALSFTVDVYLDLAFHNDLGDVIGVAAGRHPPDRRNCAAETRNLYTIGFEGVVANS